jgi:hypothetical protein
VEASTLLHLRRATVRRAVLRRRAVAALLLLRLLLLRLLLLRLLLLLLRRHAVDLRARAPREPPANAQLRT